MNDLDLCLEVVPRSRQPLRYIWRWISRKPLEIETGFQRTTNRKWHMSYRMVTYVTDDITWPWKVKLVTPIRLERNISFVDQRHRPCRYYLGCRLVTDTGIKWMHSANTRTMVVSRTQNSFGDRTFSAVAVPCLGSGTVCSLTWDYLTCPMVNLGSQLRHFFFGSRATAQCDLC